MSKITRPVKPNPLAQLIGTVLGLIPQVAIIVTHSLPEWVYWWIVVITALVVMQGFIAAALLAGEQQ